MGCLTGVEPVLQGPQPCAFPRWQKAPVDQAGLEPARRGVWGRCSAAELLIVACAQEDSNPHRWIRNPGPYPLDDGRLVVTARFERAASCVSSTCSNQLSYATTGDDDGS